MGPAGRKQGCLGSVMGWKLCRPLCMEFFPCKKNPCSALPCSAPASGILFLRCELVLSKRSRERLRQKSRRTVIPRTLNGSRARHLFEYFLEHIPLLQRCVPESSLQLQPSLLPKGEPFGSLGMYPGQPSSRLQFLGANRSSSDSAGSQAESSSCVFALSESLLSPHFTLRLFLCPFSEQGRTPGSRHRSWSRRNL